MSEDYDVLVVGAGPGGSTTAALLAEGGFRVLLVDKEVSPRQKVCGDGIAPRAVHSLRLLGVEGELEGRFRRTSGMRFYSTRGGVTEVRYPMGSRYPDHGFVVPRAELDAILLGRARESGAEIMEGCLVRGLLPPEGGRFPGVVAERQGERLEIRARYIVGADGSDSRLGRELGLLRKDPLYLGVAVRCYMKGVEGISDFLEIYPEDAISPACGWIFPVDEETANVGVGFMLYARRWPRGGVRLNLNRLLETFITGTRHAARKLAGARPVGRPRGGMLRTGLGGAFPVRDNVILVGDAASMVNPISGEGITYALESGRWAAETLASALRRGEPGLLSLYPRILELRYGRYFRQGTLAIRYFNRPSCVNPLIFATSRCAPLGEKMGRFLMNCRRRESPFGQAAGRYGRA